jgi:hypothetical protein
MSMQGLTQLLVAIAGLITASTAAFAVLSGKSPEAPAGQDQETSASSVLHLHLGLRDSKKVALASVVVAVIAYAIAVVIILYGLLAAYPLMTGFVVLEFRLLTEIVGLVAVIMGAIGIVTGFDHKSDFWFTGGIGLFGGLFVMAGMAVLT